MCVGRCKRLFYCLCGGGETRAPSSSLPIPDEAPPSWLRGCGQKEEVKLRGGVLSASKRGRSEWFEVSKRKKTVKDRKGFSVWEYSL